jgi:hypothetical protein
MASLQDEPKNRTFAFLVKIFQIFFSKITYKGCFHEEIDCTLSHMKIPLLVCFGEKESFAHVTKWLER